MLGLNNLLARFKASLDKDSANKEAISLSIKEVLSFEIKPEDILIKGDTLRIRTSPVKRNEIEIHKSRILEKIKTKTPLNLREIVY